ncbi:15906_t:CDS:2 [Dentiscutata heterogama]|uniref:15906_t:CDS:1 n=1 Tax=Dentiscutata heterogama TaxID=1316150 RepID=A0ACA9LIH0_9GLOM|nr:15906_t:CDS:2 [Dentiscutata heterogama]
MTITLSHHTKALDLIAQIASDLNGTSKTMHMLGLPKIECVKVKQLYNNSVPNDDPMTDFYEEMNEDERQRHERFMNFHIDMIPIAEKRQLYALRTDSLLAKRDRFYQFLNKL